MKSLKITAILFAVMTIVSCKKESNILPGRPGNIVQTTEPERKLLTSNWFHLNFDNIAQSENVIEGNHHLDEPINLNNKPFELLLSAKLSGLSGDRYIMIPHKREMAKLKIQYDYNLDNKLINVFYTGRNPTTMSSSSFRFIAVDLEYYHNAGIDWSDYNAVESLLSSHFTPQ